MNRIIVLVLALLIPASNLIGMAKEDEKKPIAIKTFDPQTESEHTIYTMPQSYVVVSPVIQDMYQDCNNTIYFDAENVKRFNLIKDYLEYEYNLQYNLEDSGRLNVLLLKKSEQELATLLDIADFFALQQVTEKIVTILAAKLSRPDRQKECLKTGSFGLHLSEYGQNLVAQEMCKNKSVKKFFQLLAAYKKYNININTSCFPFKEIKSILVNHSKTLLMIKFKDVEYRYPGYIIIELKTNLLNYYPSESIMTEFWSIMTEEFFNSNGSYYSTNVYFPWISFFDHNLTPEAVTLLHYYQQCEEKNNTFYFNQYPGLEIIKNALPIELQELIQTAWWSTLNFPTKAGIVTASIAVTSWTAKKLYDMWKKKK